MSFIGDAIKAPIEANTARHAQASNQRNADKTRALQLSMFEQSRGSEGSAVLPTYGKGAEQELYRGALGVYDLTGLSPEAQFAQYQKDVAAQQPSFEKGNAFVDSIYSGAMQDQRLAEAQPVMQARTNLAATQKQSIWDEWNQRLRAMDAQDARKGFVGSGTGFANAQLRTAIPFAQRAAGVGAQASLENAMQAQGIQDTQRNLQYQSLGIPLQRAQEALSLRQLPNQALITNQLASQKPFGMFNIGTAAFRPDYPPLVQPIPNGGALAGAALGGLGNDLSQIYANNQRNKAIQSLYAKPSNSPSVNPYATGSVNYDMPNYAPAYSQDTGSADVSDISSIYGLMS